jgi:hypothetical protein
MTDRGGAGRPLNSGRFMGLAVGLTASFVGYFLVWLPGPAAGLQLVGIELGEWIKFLGVGLIRNLFYLPPVALGLALALLAATWPNDRSRTWLARLMAVAVAWLAFPAILSIQSEPPSQWLPRLAAIGLVALVALAGALPARNASIPAAPWLLMAIVAVLGAILPTVAYFAIQPVTEAILRRPIAIGPGVWLNAAGWLVVVVVATTEFMARRQKKRQPSG